jgi:pSer/pThr/pTyr-binding forkhead associated (FHA) protein
MKEDRGKQASLRRSIGETVFRFASSCRLQRFLLNIRVDKRLKSQYILQNWNTHRAMARLVVKSEGFSNQVIDLKLGVNRVGRNSANDFQIEHPTISSQHCELEIAGDELIVRDCNSTNGTFVSGDAVKEARLSAGQSFCLGDVELFVESTEQNVAVPELQKPRVAAPPIVSTDGSLICPRHPHTQVTHQCTHCREVMCDACVTNMRRRGGKLLKLCPLCSRKVELLGDGKKKKKSLIGFLHRTIKMPFLHSSKADE